MARVKFVNETEFKATDKHSRVFNKMGRNADRFGDRSSRAFKKLNKQATKTSTIMKGVLGAGAVSKGLSVVSMGVQSVTTDFLNFDNAILSASAKFKGLDLSTKAGINTLNQLKKTARVVGRDTEFNAAQAAGGLDFLALAGFNAGQAMSLLPGVTNLATVAQVDLATATDIASDSLGAFGLMTDNTAELTKNFNRVQDVMAKTTATSNTNLTDMFEAVKKGAPDFTAAGQSIETFSALIGTMANAGIKGAEAGTKLRNIAVRLTGGSKEAAAMIKDLGIEVADGSGNFRDMIDIIDDVIKGTEKMGSVQRSAALKTIFGARQTGGLNVILKEGTEQLRSYRQMLIDSKGSAEKMAKVMRSSLMNRLKSLGSAATEVGFQIFDAFDEVAAKGIENMTEALRKVDLTPILTDLITMSQTFGEISTQTEAFEQAGKTFDSFTGAFKGAGESLKVFTDVLPDLPKDMNALNTALLPITNTLAFLENVLKGITFLIEKVTIPATKIAAGTKEGKERLRFGGGKTLHEISRDEGLTGIFRAITGGSDFSKRQFQERERELGIRKDEFGGSLSPPPPQDGTNNINLNINGAPAGTTVDQKTKGSASPVNITGLGQRAALQAAN